MVTKNPQSKLNWLAEIFTRQDPSRKISKNLHHMKITHFTVLLLCSDSIIVYMRMRISIIAMQLFAGNRQFILH